MGWERWDKELRSLGKSAVHAGRETITSEELGERSLNVADTADVAHFFVVVIVIVACRSIGGFLRREPLNVFCGQRSR